MPAARKTLRLMVVGVMVGVGPEATYRPICESFRVVRFRGCILFSLARRGNEVVSVTPAGTDEVNLRMRRSWVFAMFVLLALSVAAVAVWPGGPQ
jgi:hypothetical protein